MLVTATTLLLLLWLIAPNHSGRGCLMWTAARVFDLAITMVLLWLLFHITR